MSEARLAVLPSGDQPRKQWRRALRHGTGWIAPPPTRIKYCNVKSSFSGIYPLALSDSTRI